MKRVIGIQFVSSCLPEVGRVVGFMSAIQQNTIYEVGIDQIGNTYLWIAGARSNLKIEDFKKGKMAPKLEALLRRFEKYRNDCQTYALTGDQELWWKVYNANVDANIRLKNYKYAKGFTKQV